MTISDYRVLPVRQKLFELGFVRIQPGIYRRSSDNQTVEMVPPSSPSDNWCAYIN